MGESVGWQVTVQVVIKAFEGRRLRMESVEPCIQSSDGRQSKHCMASYYTPLKKEEGKKRKKIVRKLPRRRFPIEKQHCGTFKKRHWSRRSTTGHVAMWRVPRLQRLDGGGGQLL